MKSDLLTPEKRIKLASENLQRFSFWISNSDAKIGMLLVFQTGLSAFLTTKGSEIKQIATIQPFDLSHFILYISLLCFAVFITTSTAFTIRAVFPDTRIREHSLFFFGSVATMGLEKYKSDFASLTEEDIEDGLHRQTVINAQIANTKFNRIKTSMLHLIFAGISWIVSLVLIAAFAPVKT